MPQQFLARFLEAEAVQPMNALVRLAVPAAVATAATPGQFLMLGNGRRDPLLPRPYSIMRANRAARGGADGAASISSSSPAGAALGLGDAHPGDAFPGARAARQRIYTRRARPSRPADRRRPRHRADDRAGRDRPGARRRGDHARRRAEAASLLPLTYLPEEAEIVVATADGSRGHHGAVTDLVADLPRVGRRDLRLCPGGDLRRPARCAARLSRRAHLAARCRPRWSARWPAAWASASAASWRPRPAEDRLSRRSGLRARSGSMLG